MIAVVEAAQKCELCGSERELQAHHIIPVTCGGTDDKENLLCVCKRCHALLTPHSLLVKLGQKKVTWEIDFWEGLDKAVENGEVACAVDVMDYCEFTFFPKLREMLGNN